MQKKQKKIGLNNTLGDGLFSIFGDTKKKNDASWDKIKGKSLIGNIGKVPGALIKCIVTLEKEKLRKEISLDPDEETYRFNQKTARRLGIKKGRDRISEFEHEMIDSAKIEEIMPLEEFFVNIRDQGEDTGDQLTENMADSEHWSTASKFDIEYKWLDKQITKEYIEAANEDSGHNEFIACRVFRALKNSNRQLLKEYQVFLNIIDFKKNRFESPSDKKYNENKNNSDKIYTYKAKDLLIDKGTCPRVKIIITRS